MSTAMRNSDEQRRREAHSGEQPETRAAATSSAEDQQRRRAADLGRNLLNEETGVSSTWRSELSNVYIWYASYGSNMCKARLNCYLAGGQVEGMQRACSGSVNRTLPKEILWKTFPCHKFFGRDSSRSWGIGGVAFINPEKNFQHNTYMCLYKISLEQFNDILFQENGLSLDIGSPLFDINNLNAISNKEFNSLQVVKGWYGNVVYLGKEQDIPVITMTCSLLDIEHFKSGKLPLRAPNEAYANTLIKGLVDGEQLSEVEAIAYIGAAKTTWVGR